jgi:hypothetical protein
MAAEHVRGAISRGALLVTLAAALGGCPVHAFDQRSRDELADGAEAGERASPEAGLDPDASMQSDADTRDGAAALDGSSSPAHDGAIGSDSTTEGPSSDGGDGATGTMEASLPVPRFDDAGCPIDERGQRISAAYRGAGSFVERARVTTPALRSRSLGPSLALDGERLWLFNLSYIPRTPARPASTPNNYPVAAYETNTPWLRAANDPDRTFTLDAPLAPDGTVQPLVTLAADEPHETTDLSPYSIFPSATGALIFGQKFVFTNPPREEVWLADLPRGARVATRRAAPLFVQGEPLFMRGGVRDETHTYLYACLREDRGIVGNGFCHVARAPNASADQRAAYQVRTQLADGQLTWSSTLSSGVRVIDDVGGDLSVAYNPYLRKYLAVHSPSLGNSIVLQAADSPAGPFTRLEQIPLPMPVDTATWANSYAREHPSLQQRCGARIVVTYLSPTKPGPNNAFIGDGEVVLGTLEMN